MSLLRDGFADWLLLRRGDVWSESFGRLQASGRRAAEPLLISSYGDARDRPLLLLGDFGGGIEILTGALSNIAIVGIHFYDQKGDPGSEHFVRDRDKRGAGVHYSSLGENVLVEDCRFQMLSGVVAIGRIWVPPNREQPEWGADNIQVRRCVVQGAWTTSGHCQGCFFNEIDGLLLEENVLDHNGWNLDAGDLPTQFNHNVYITINCDNVIARGNLVTRGATTGLYCRTNGILEGNLCVDNSPALNLGRITKFRPGGVTGRVSGNVVIGAPTRTGNKDMAIVSNGIEVGNISLEGAVVENNILIGTDDAEGIALKISPLGVGVHYVRYRNNIVYNWPRALNWVGTPGGGLADHQVSGMAFEGNHFQLHVPTAEPVPFIRSRDTADMGEFSLKGNTYWHEPADSACVAMMENDVTLREWVASAAPDGDRIEKIQFVDPHRTVGSYHATLGKPPTLEAFLSEACEQSRLHWREEYTARAVIEYIREGFRRTR